MHMIPLSPSLLDLGFSAFSSSFFSSSCVLADSSAWFRSVLGDYEISLMSVFVMSMSDERDTGTSQ